jgi:hypothetical protein
MAGDKARESDLEFALRVARNEIATARPSYATDNLASARLRAGLAESALRALVEALDARTGAGR